MATDKPKRARSLTPTKGLVSGVTEQYCFEFFTPGVNRPPVVQIDMVNFLPDSKRYSVYIHVSDADRTGRPKLMAKAIWDFWPFEHKLHWEKPTIYRPNHQVAADLTGYPACRQTLELAVTEVLARWMEGCLFSDNRSDRRLPDAHFYQSKDKRSPHVVHGHKTVSRYRNPGVKGMKGTVRKQPVEYVRAPCIRNAHLASPSQMEIFQAKLELLVAAAQRMAVNLGLPYGSFGGHKDAINVAWRGIQHA